MVHRLFRKRSSSSFSPSSSSLTTKTTLTYPRISTGNKLKSPHIERKYSKARSARQKSTSTFGHTDDFVARDIANEVLGTGGAYAGNMTEVNSRGLTVSSMSSLPRMRFSALAVNNTGIPDPFITSTAAAMRSVASEKS